MIRFFTILTGLFMTQFSVQAQQELPESYQQDLKAQVKSLRKAITRQAFSNQANLDFNRNTTTSRVIGISSYQDDGGTLSRQDSSALTYSNSSLVSTYDYYINFEYNISSYTPSVIALGFPLGNNANTEYSTLDYYTSYGQGGDILDIKRRRTYNSNNQLTEAVLSADPAGIGFVDYNKTVYAYDQASSRITNLYELMWNGIDYDTIVRAKYAYNAAGRYSEGEMYIDYSGMEVFQKFEFVWNGANVESILVSMKLAASDPWEPVTSIAVTYANGLATNILEKITDGTNWVDVYKEDYTYNASRQPLTKETYLLDDFSGQWVKESGLAFTYNNNGLPEVVQVSYLDAGVLVDVFLGFFYNSDNLPVRRAEAYDPNITQISAEQRYYYEVITGLNELDKKVQTLSFYPNPASQSLLFRGDANYKTYHIVNLAGQVVESGSFGSQSGSLDVQQLPSGNYVIQVIDDKGQRYAAPFIKQ